MQIKNFKMTLKEGLYAREAEELVENAMKYHSSMTILVDNKRIDLKSIMGVLSLELCKDMEIAISAEGLDEKEAIQSITNKIIDMNIGIERK